MNTTFIITGGAGRVINAIPALEKYEKLNPNDDFKIIVHGWEQLFWSHPTLQSRTFGTHQKGTFEQHIKNNNVVSPEPYQLHSFFNQKCNLVEAFDECINHTQEHSDLNLNCLYMSDFEQHNIAELISKFKEDKKKKKVVVFQPYGSAVDVINKQPIDRSNRSLLLKDYFEIVKAISNNAAVVYISHPQFRHPNDNFSISIDDYQPYLRTMMGVISKCDFYVGVCSVGQHMARAFNKPGLVLMGATNEKNYSYPDHFKIFRKKGFEPTYSPWRLSESDCEFSDRANDGIMHYTEDELNDIVKIINSSITETITLNVAENTFLNGQYN